MSLPAVSDQAKQNWGLLSATSSVLTTAKCWAKNLKREVSALNHAYHDPRCPVVAKIVAVATVAYALSPIDLIPDFIPVLGQLDDLIIVPLGIALSRKLIPEEVMHDARKAVDGQKKLPKNWVTGACIVATWAAGGYAMARYFQIV